MEQENDAKIVRATSKIQKNWRRFQTHRVEQGMGEDGNVFHRLRPRTLRERSVILYFWGKVVSIFINAGNEKWMYNILRYLGALLLFLCTSWMADPLGKSERDELNVIRGKYFDEFLMPNDVQIGRHSTKDAFIYAPALNSDDALHFLNVVQAFSERYL